MDLERDECRGALVDYSTGKKITNMGSNKEGGGGRAK